MFKLGLNIIGSCLLILTISGCQKKEAYSNIKIIGHAGNGLSNLNTFHHDNSLESIKLALTTYGCDGVELDVQLSADKTLWLYHDPDLDTETSGNGCIPNRTDSYLKGLNYSTANKELLLSISDIPSEYLAGKLIYIDIRSLNACSGDEVSLTNFLIALNVFRAQNPTSEIIICTGSVAWLNAFKNDNYRVMAQITNFSQYGYLLTAFPLLDGVVVSNSDINRQEVSLIQSDGIEVVLFDVRSALGIRSALKKMPNELMTDNIHKALIEKY